RDPGAAHLRRRDRGAEGRDRPRAVEEPAGQAGARGGMRFAGNAGGGLQSQDGFRRGAIAMTASAHLDTFARDNLPPRAQWPDFRFDLPELRYPERLNCAVELLDRWLTAGHGEGPGRVAPAETRAYAQLAGPGNALPHRAPPGLGISPGA